jgi:hypothetical protein
MESRRRVDRLAIGSGDAWRFGGGGEAGPRWRADEAGAARGQPDDRLDDVRRAAAITVAAGTGRSIPVGAAGCRFPRGEAEMASTQGAVLERHTTGRARVAVRAAGPQLETVPAANPGQPDNHGPLKHSSSAEVAFKHQHPCPSTCESSGAFQGYVIAQVKPEGVAT